MEKATELLASFYKDGVTISVLVSPLRVDEAKSIAMAKVSMKMGLDINDFLEGASFSISST